MIPILLHIYGPLYIQSYGFFIVLGVVSFIFFVKNDRHFKSLKIDNYLFSIMYCAIFAALIGGRMLSSLTDSTFSSWQDFFSPLNPGFSILGSVIGILLSTPLFLKFLNLPILPCMDVIATHAPLVQACGRIGCFFAGCCYGTESYVLWSITYTHDLSLAPCNISLHPTQLYSALLLFLIFLFLKRSSLENYITPGKQTVLYLILVSFERFFTDFWRQERFSTIFHSSIFFISDNQLVSILIIFLSLFLFLLTKNKYLIMKKI